MESLKIKTNFSVSSNDIIIVELGGYVDQGNSAEVEKVISDILNSGKRKIVFDLSELVYMSSAGWGIFVGEIKTVREEDGDIKIAAMTPEVYEVFQMLEFYHIIQDYVTVNEAVMSFPDAVPVNNKGDDFDDNGVDDTDFSDLLEKSGVSSTLIKDHDDEIIVEHKKPAVKVAKKPEPATTPVQRPVKKEPATEFHPATTEREIDVTKLPLNEKIKKVVANYPLLSIFKIRKMLAHEKFGYTNIGRLKLYLTLKILNLETRTKRYRFHRSV